MKQCSGLQATAQVGWKPNIRLAPNSQAILFWGGRETKGNRVSISSTLSEANVEHVETLAVANAVNLVLIYDLLTCDSYEAFFEVSKYVL